VATPCNPNYIGSEDQIKTKRPYLKNNLNEKARGMAQVLEDLASKGKALSSNPSNAKKRKIK
jgi:hypothetical protein